MPLAGDIWVGVAGAMSEPPDDPVQVSPGATQNPFVQDWPSGHELPAPHAYWQLVTVG
jgi:hypothetical protein